jgi:hypothetical protein
MPLEVTLQYFDDCPNWQLAERDLKEAIRQLDLDADVTYRKVASHEDAEELGFRGSPTILVSGRDPFAEADAPVGLSCRVYRTGKGSSGTPGVDALKRALGGTGS